MLLLGRPQHGDGYCTGDRTHERHAGQPQQPWLSGVTKQHDADDTGHHGLSDHESGGGAVDLRARLIPATAIRIVAVVGIAIATLGLVITAFSPPATQIATGPQPCVNGVVPLNPYIINCNLPKRGNQVIGAAPDAGAIIACRHQPGMPVLVRELSRDSTSPRLSALIHRRAENPSDSVAHG